jgi:branched-chain amino acid transport system ATP-binding protein
VLEVGDLHASYGQIRALRGVSLSVPEGKLTCLLGPNGAGKTTLMFTIAGILRARQGSVKLEGVELVGLASHHIVGRGIVLVPENRLVFADMTVRENLLAGAYLRLADRPAVEADIEAMMARFPRLKERAAQNAGTLSGGEQQMLAVARALMARPRVLLMDEPSLGLAPLIVEEIFQVIGELRAEGRTILLVEQNAHMALKHADKFYLLERGQVTFEGTPGELEQDEVIRRAYLGSAKAG